MRRSPATSRNASSIEIPSTSGVVSRNTSKTARLAAVYASIRGGTTTASGHSRARQAPAHRRAHPVRLRLVARGEHDPAADDHRPPAQPRVVALLDRGVERVEIGVQDRRRLGHEHMFEQSSLAVNSVSRRRSRVDRGGPARGGRRGGRCAMAETVGDHVLAAAARVGGRAGLRLPRRRDQRHRRRVRARPATSPRFIQARHEEMSAFQAVGYAKFSGKVGVCMATCGPGRDPPAQRALRRQARPRAGRRDRRADRAQRDGRLLPAGGRPAGAVQGRRERVPRRGQRPRAAAERDRPRLPHRADPPRARPRSSSRATCRTEDVLARPSTRSSRCRPARRGLPAPTVVPARRGDRPRRRGAQRRASRSRSWSARAPAARAEEVAQVADVLGAGVAKALLGKDVLSRRAAVRHRRRSACSAPGPSYEMMRDCDTLLIVGSNFPYSQFLPEFGKARAVQIDLDGTLIGMRYPTEVNLVGDAAATLRALLPLLSAPDGPRLARDDRGRTSPRWWDDVSGRRCWTRSRSTRCGSSGSCPSGCPTNAIVTADSGSVGQLVRPPPADPRRRPRLAVRHPRHDGRGRAVRDRRQVRPPRPAGDRAHRRRGHADERHGRAADHRSATPTAGPTRG